MTNKKGDKKGDKRKQKGDRADTVTNKKGWKADTLSQCWKGEKGGCQQCRHRTCETKVNKSHGQKCCMASGKGRTPAVQAPNLGDKSKEITIEMLHGQRKRADTSSDKPGRQMNRIEMLHGQRKRADTTNDRPGRHMHRNATWSTEKGGHQQ